MIDDVAPDVPREPPNELTFRRQVHIRTAVRELWGARDLVRTLIERELRARYKQALLGFLWAIIAPLSLLIVFTLIFGRVAKVSTGGAPSTLFFYVGLLAWTLFSTSVAQGGISIVQNKAILNKVYCPRETFPISAVGVAVFDTVLASSALVLLFIVNGFVPRETTPWIVIIIPIHLAFTIGVTLAISAVLVHLRDISQAMPLILQLGLFATPVGYRFEQIPKALRWVYALVNPMGPVIDNYRRVMLYGRNPTWGILGLAAVGALATLVLGYGLFKRLETGFADVA